MVARDDHGGSVERGEVCPGGRRAVGGAGYLEDGCFGVGEAGQLHETIGPVEQTPSRIGLQGVGREVCQRWFRSEEHTSELQSLMRISYAVFCLKKKNKY